MADKLNILIVDDEPEIAGAMAAMLEMDGHKTTHDLTGQEALSRLETEQFDVLLIDIMMPRMDGFELCKRIRDDSRLDNTKVIVCSAKTYQADRNRALQLGADGYIVKSIDPDAFLKEVLDIARDRILTSFWGVRGTLPVPGDNAIRYGGNTSCVTLEFAQGPLFIFDAGTGIKRLSDHLTSAGPARLRAKLFISHPHWDHINALPFFAPLYMQGNDIEILGANHGDIGVRDLIAAQMDDVYFPITIHEFAAHVEFRDLHEEEIDLDGITVRTMLLSHPGNCLGYRIDYKDRAVCYITDNELFLEGDPGHNPAYFQKLADFVRGADILITDCTYRDTEYPAKIGWGHSSVGEVARLAHAGEVGTLYLFHHDPDQSDDDIDLKLAETRQALRDLGAKVECVAPAEGETVSL